MIIKKKYHKNLFNIMISTVFVVGFGFIIITADRYNINQEQNLVSASFLQTQDYKSDSYIPLNDIIITDNYSNKFIYIVQPGDNISTIAYNFGTTVHNIQTVNKLKNGYIKPGDKLIISEEEGFIYEIDENISINNFALKYNLNIEELKNINYISEENFEFQEGDEVFLSMSYEKAKQLGIIKLTRSNSESNNKNLNKSNTRNNLPKKSILGNNSSEKQNIIYNGVSIISKYYYRPSIKNGFYAGHCTRYVAIVKFPYLSKAKQQRIWGGNAKEWYNNAKNAGYSVGKNPKLDSIVVIKYGGSKYYNYGHVGIVREIDSKNSKILIEDMNAYGRFVVTKRWIPMDNKIIGYIY